MEDLENKFADALPPRRTLASSVLEGNRIAGRTSPVLSSVLLVGVVSILFRSIPLRSWHQLRQSGLSAETLNRGS
ncbi:hypothetical protein ZHAS_00012935 [Anopheles sinensis]|uniref:Uncharacterized protein n=1 Tax=Anopheles sinensis TaxID=74873 RepID=A0A084W454_ANOSI|nr:hypothetical protein ZHAS_00012935 [Anopheles sinensis]